MRDTPDGDTRSKLHSKPVCLLSAASVGAGATAIAKATGTMTGGLTLGGSDDEAEERECSLRRMRKLCAAGPVDRAGNFDVLFKNPVGSF